MNEAAILEARKSVAKLYCHSAIANMETASTGYLHGLSLDEVKTYLREAIEDFHKAHSQCCEMIEVAEKLQARHNQEEAAQ